MQPEGQGLEGRKINSERDNEMELSTPRIILIYSTKQNGAPSLRIACIWDGALGRCVLLSPLPYTMELSSLHCLYLLRGERCSRLPCIACILFLDGALRLLGSLGSPFRIVRFSSLISRLGWEVFHQSDCLVFHPHLPCRLGGFSPNQLALPQRTPRG